MAKKIPDPPEWFTGTHGGQEAVDEWNRIIPEIERRGLLSVIDINAVAAYCAQWGRLVNAERWIAENGATIVIRDKDGRVKSVTKAPQVGIARESADFVSRFLADFGIKPWRGSQAAPSGQTEST